MNRKGLNRRRRSHADVARRRAERNRARRQAARSRRSEPESQLCLTVVVLDVSNCTDRDAAMVGLRAGAEAWGADRVEYDDGVACVSVIGLWPPRDDLSPAEFAAYATFDYIDSLGIAPVLYVGSGRAGAILPEVALRPADHGERVAA